MELCAKDALNILHALFGDIWRAYVDTIIQKTGLAPAISPDVNRFNYCTVQIILLYTGKIRVDWPFS